LAINYLKRHDMAHIAPTEPEDSIVNNPSKEPRGFTSVYTNVGMEKSENSLQEVISQSKRMGYTGDACTECGKFTMVRNGTCAKCNNCGATNGCS